RLLLLAALLARQRRGQGPEVDAAVPEPLAREAHRNEVEEGALAPAGLPEQDQPPVPVELLHRAPRPCPLWIDLAATSDLGLGVVARGEEGGVDLVERDRLAGRAGRL